MNIEIRNDIPLKYELGAHRLAPSYPSPDDILFDLIGYVLSQQKRRKNIVIADMIVDSSDMGQIFSHLEEDDKTKLKESLSKLLAEQAIQLNKSETGTSLAITKDGISKFYKLK